LTSSAYNLQQNWALNMPANNADSRALELNNIERWWKENNLALNRSKIVEIVITDGKKCLANQPPPLSGISRTSTSKILGVTISYITNIISKCSQTVLTDNTPGPWLVWRCSPVSAYTSHRHRPVVVARPCRRLRPGGVSRPQLTDNDFPPCRLRNYVVEFDKDYSNELGHQTRNRKLTDDAVAAILENTYYVITPPSVLRFG